MKIISTLFTTLIFLAFIHTTHAEELFVATYKGNYSGLNITLERRLTQTGEHTFKLTSSADNFLGFLFEESQFSIIDKNMIANNYAYTRKILGKKSEQKLTFDWSKNIAHYRRSDKPKKNADVALPAKGVLDPSLYQLKLQQELYLKKENLSFTFAKDRRIKNLTFKTIGETEYKLDKKTYLALEIERINQTDDSKTNVLVIPALNFQIARIIQTDKRGKKHKIELIKYNGNSEAVANFYNSIIPSAHDK